MTDTRQEAVRVLAEALPEEQATHDATGLPLTIVLFMGGRQNAADIILSNLTPAARSVLARWLGAGDGLRDELATTRRQLHELVMDAENALENLDHLLAATPEPGLPAEPLEPPLDVDRLARSIDAAWRREGADHHLFGPGLADEGRRLARLIAAEWPDA